MRNTVLAGASVLALSLAAPALAQEPEDDRVCIDQACQMVSLFGLDGSGAASEGEVEGVEAPRYGTWGFDLAGRDLSVAPGDDFNRHASGLALDAMEIPADRSRYGMFDILRELSENRLERLVAEMVADPAPVAGSDEARIADLYRSFIDTDRVDALDDAPLRPHLQRIAAIGDHADLAAYMGADQAMFGAGLFGLYIGDDARQPDAHAIYLSQGGIGLPNRDYYLNERFARERAAYQAYVGEMLTMAGWENAGAAAEAIVAFEHRLAEVHWTRAESRNRDRVYNPMSLSELQAEAPGFDWAAYFEQAGMGGRDRFIATQNTAIAPMAAIYAETPIETLRAWQVFRAADRAAPYLSQRFVDAQWRFRANVLAGQPEQRTREKRAIDFIEGVMGQALGRAYVEEYFPPEYRAQMDELVVNIRLAMAERIRNLPWMSEETRAAALDKLDKFGVKIGYPDEWRDYSSLSAASDDLFGNLTRSNAFDWAYALGRLDRPVDPNEWSMTPQTVNAYYSSTKNEIVFPAAILQPPFFDPQADPAVNYGAIGGVIGHEIGHGFDDQGRKSDGDGVLRDWWTQADADRFQAQASILGAQYEQFEPLPGFPLVGALTMGENIGDLAGVTLAITAYRVSLNGAEAPVLDGVTGDQRVFYGWAQVWRARYRDEAMRNQVANGPHSPPQFRVIGPVRNVDAWYDAFGVTPDNHYYVAPENRVRLW